MVHKDRSEEPADNQRQTEMNKKNTDEVNEVISRREK